MENQNKYLRNGVMISGGLTNGVSIIDFIFRVLDDSYPSDGDIIFHFKDYPGQKIKKQILNYSDNVGFVYNDNIDNYLASYIDILKERKSQISSDSKNPTKIFSKLVIVLFEFKNFYDAIYKFEEIHKKSFFDYIPEFLDVNIQIVLTMREFNISESIADSFKLRHYFGIRYYLGGMSPEMEESFLGEKVYLSLASKKYIVQEPGEIIKEKDFPYRIKKTNKPKWIINEIIDIRKGNYNNLLRQVRFMLIKPKIVYLFMNNFLEMNFDKDIEYSLDSLCMGKILFDNIVELSKSDENNDSGKLEEAVIKKYKELDNSYEWLSSLKGVKESDNDAAEVLSFLVKHYIKEYSRLKTPSINKCISAVAVSNLFHYRNYVIEFSGKNISLLYSTNGFGKTTVLNLLHAILRTSTTPTEDIQNIYYIFDVPFDSFEIDFEDGTKVMINKEGNNIKIYYFWDVMNKDKNVSISFNNRSDLIKQSKLHYYMIEHFYRNDLLFIPLNKEDTGKEFLKYLSAKLLQYNPSKENWLYENLSRSNFEKEYDIFLNKSFGKDLSNKIRSLCNDLNELLIFEEDVYKNSISIDKKLYNKVKEMVEVNFIPKDFIDTTHSMHFEIRKSEDDDGDVLAVETCHADWADVFNVNNPLSFKSIRNLIEELYNLFLKFNLFKKHFESIYDEYNPTRKEVLFDNKQNLLFKNVKTGEFVDASLLSSGEGNIAKIIYKLVFETKEKKVILIDEPEVSLHIAWQDRLMRIISELIKEIDDVELIIATHSPFIGADYNEYECKVSLKRD